MEEQFAVCGLFRLPRSLHGPVCLPLVAPSIDTMIRRANFQTVTDTAKAPTPRTRRNIRPPEEVAFVVQYEPQTGTFVERATGTDAVWRFRRTDCEGTPYESTRNWELVKVGEHWYDPRQLARYLITGEWHPVGTWVATVGDRYDYAFDNLELRKSGSAPTRPPVEVAPVRSAFVVDEERLALTVPRGLFARLAAWFR